MPQHKILLAEDDSRFRRHLARALMDCGFQVVCVEDGYQALEFAVRQKPDLLILDVHMPAGDGFSVHERMQLHPEIALKPVIYMTHDPSSDIEAVAAEHGILCLLHKPFTMTDLLEMVTAALSYGTADAV